MVEASAVHTAAPDDTDLIAECGRGDRAAFAELYERHVRTVYRYAFSIVGERLDAEDVTQDVFVTAWRRRRAVTLVDRSALPWLLVTARNTSLNKVRSMKRSRVEVDTEVVAREAGRVATPESEAERSELARVIQSAVDDLSETDQILYYLCIVEGSSYKDAAATMGATHAAVRNRLMRIRRALRRDIAGARGGRS